MQISSDTTFVPGAFQPTRRLGRSQELAPEDESSLEADDSTVTGSPFSFQKELSPEEQQRVEFLQNLLAQTLAMAEGNPTDEQKTRIRDIENELEKITGVKMQSRISNMTAKMPGKTSKEEEKEREQRYQFAGIDPKEAMHNNKQVSGKNDNPGMQMLRRNALLSSISLEGLPTLASLND
ncbi:hypothetical protein [uncultured Pseudodesulfovibrio sp.]|uniref:hypothetical protein n=1 Tax=uncultured Pseudodesulfovibrio sp. TaxID=2035858 RepID=UPI0029C94227|nr:hypothetical protein [uncultured Pseudodesulfovibrio sp.]